MKQKTFFTLLLLMLSSIAFSQKKLSKKVMKEFHKIDSIEWARSFKKDHPEATMIIMSVSELSDSSKMDKRFLSMQVGEEFKYTMRNTEYLHRVVQIDTLEHSRVQYIYFNANVYAMELIDSLRLEILTKHLNGASFGDLADKYSMDKETIKGDLGWFFEGEMDEKFEFAVLRQRKGQVFTTDIPKKKWHYVVKKTHEETKARVVRVVRLKL